MIDHFLDGLFHIITKQPPPVRVSCPNDNNTLISIVELQPRPLPWQVTSKKGNLLDWQFAEIKIKVNVLININIFLKLNELLINLGTQIFKGCLSFIDQDWLFYFLLNLKYNIIWRNSSPNKIIISLYDYQTRFFSFQYYFFYKNLWREILKIVSTFLLRRLT